MIMTSTLIQFHYQSKKGRSQASFLIPNDKISKDQREELKIAQNGSLVLGPITTWFLSQGKTATDFKTQTSIANSLASICGETSINCLKTKNSRQWNRYLAQSIVGKLKEPITHVYQLEIQDLT